jgi:hypothetical protein
MCIHNSDTCEHPHEKLIIICHVFDRNAYWGACALGGLLACGTTHTFVTPLDLVKCNMQANPKAFPSMGAGFKKIYKLGGLGGLYRGWVPTLYGYSVQGTLLLFLYFQTLTCNS